MDPTLLATELSMYTRKSVLRSNKQAMRGFCEIRGRQINVLVKIRQQVQMTATRKGWRNFFRTT